MEFIEKVADKIVPWMLTAIIIAGFTMYMDVQRLKEVAIDYKNRADKAHAKYDNEIRANREALIRLGERK